MPELPPTLFGWIPVLYNIPEEEVIASAGLDAFAFLSFFRYAIRFLLVSLFFSLAVLLPVNYRYTGDLPWRDEAGSEKPKVVKSHPGVSWTHAGFTYIFTAVALYLLMLETRKIIRIRQAYLGSQSTITDRTIRLSGIPKDMRTEERIHDFVEELEIGKVDSVMLCSDWSELDQAVDARMSCLRKLETAWTAHLGHPHSLRHARKAHAQHSTDADDNEQTTLLPETEMGRSHASDGERTRPLHLIRYGFFMLQSKKVDAIDYFEEKLRKYDEQISALRKSEFPSTPLAFVTLESTAACQMAIQAILDPTPGQLIANPAPPPADVVWRNTYLSRNNRMFRSWSIMVFIGLLSIFWVVLLIPLATLLDIDAIDRLLPGFKKALEDQPNLQSLVSSGLPTLIFSLLAVAVPYLYDWLSNMQGMTSQGDVELSLISKNYFFTFFNLFIVFTLLGTTSRFYGVWDSLKKLLDLKRWQDAAVIASAVARALEALSPFYTNLIILQGVGLFPFRLLEFGAVALYPVWLLTARTPRDHAELTKPPIFSYGYYLPQSMLVFVACIMYSILPRSWLITVFGLIYFFIGGFIYKYQLLYAMDHRQHSTGRAWPMICQRVFVGLIVFQIAMSGVLALRTAFSASLSVLPLLVATVWFSFYFSKSYQPLMQFIALRSIDRQPPEPEIPVSPGATWDRDTEQGRTVDTSDETGMRYINPNLTMPLEALWIRSAGHGRSEPRIV